MPKIVDHQRRRDEIALVACRVVAEYGFDQATIVRIARAAGYTTGMVAHYFDTKQEIIIAALRLILRRIEERLTAAAGEGGGELLALLTEALPVDAPRFTECAFWAAFWGQVSADRRLKRINGLTASVVASPRDWPAARQVGQLRLQLEMLHAWARRACTAAGQVRSSRRAAAAPA